MIIHLILAIVEWFAAAVGLTLLWLAYVYQVPGLLLPAGMLAVLAFTIRGFALLRSNNTAIERVFAAEPSEERP